jgi:hydroxyacylglutathione hydrolase
MAVISVTTFSFFPQNLFTVSNRLPTAIGPSISLREDNTWGRRQFVSRSGSVRNRQTPSTDLSNTTLPPNSITNVPSIASGSDPGTPQLTTPTDGTVGSHSAVTMTLAMYLEAFADNPFATNCWLLAPEGQEEAVVIDPGFSPDRVKGLLRAAGKRPVAVLATHGHYDHVGAVAELCGTELPFYIHKGDEQAMVDPVAWGAGMPVPIATPQDMRTFTEGEVLELAGLSLEVIHTPGHTPGSSCFKVDGLLFSGDLVFRGAIGRYDFPNASAEDMWASLRRFLALPDELDVYPGHGDTTTVELERRTNPFLRNLA